MHSGNSVAEGERYRVCTFVYYRKESEDSVAKRAVFDTVDRTGSDV